MRGFVLTVLIAGTAFAGSMDEARRYERLMQQAAALHEEAEHARSDAAAKGNVAAARGKAKALDQKAEALEHKARGSEPADWPPAE